MPTIPSKITDAKLLQIHPIELQFPLELKKQVSCSVKLSNNSDNYVAFKVKTTHPKNYCVRPNTGVVSPHSSCNVTVTKQALMEYPPDMKCKDKFLIQSAVVYFTTKNNITSDQMFNKLLGNQADECKLRVSYVSPGEKTTTSTTTSQALTQRRKSVEVKPSPVRARVQSSSAPLKKSPYKKKNAWSCFFAFGVNT